MKVCVECGCVVEATVERRGVGGGVPTADSVRLARCQSCGAVCDRYEEYDALLVLLDAMLLRRPALRHLLCNHTDPSPPQPRRAETLAALAALCWLGGLRLAGPVQHRLALTALLTAAGALPLGVLRACGVFPDAHTLRRAAVVALDVAFPLAALALVWGPSPHHILHTGAAILYFSVLYNAANIFSSSSFSKHEQQRHEQQEQEEGRTREKED